MTEITVGLVGEAEETVSTTNTAAAYGAGLVPAYGTPSLIALMENATVEAIHPYLPPGQTSVGIEIRIQHLAATPVGMHARARATVIAVDGRRITFQVQAWDDREKIGEGTIARMIVDEKKFNERLKQKI